MKNQVIKIGKRLHKKDPKTVTLDALAVAVKDAACEVIHATCPPKPEQQRKEEKENMTQAKQAARAAGDFTCCPLQL
eukprot:1147689-Pelagomonas_calceolata.AAC.2